LGTNGLQQAVASLTSQVGKLTNSIGQFASATTRSSSSSSYGMGSNWNNNSNRNTYSSNGGGGRFTVGSQRGGAANGGGGQFGNLMGMSRMSATGGAVMGVASALTSYANKNMSTNMQMDYFGTQASVAGGGGRAGAVTAQRQVFSNNYAALNATDAARSGYLNQYTFGNSQFNGQANPAFSSGMRQAGGFAYANPTQGAYGGALAAQQTFSARATMVAPALGLASPILAGGVKNSMGNIAQSIMSRTFGNQTLSNKQMNAALSQGGSLDVNLQYFGQAMGWNQSTVQEYRNVLQGQVAAQNKGMSESKYYNLLGQASGGNKSAINQLAKTTGMGTSMFENQRNLNATRLTRQEDILESLAPAFDTATKAVTKFSQALTATLQATGMDKLIGGASGALSPISGALGGLSSGFGAGMGLLGAARLFGGFGGGGGGVAGGLINATRGASGAYNITSLGATAGSRLSMAGPLGLGATVMGASAATGWWMGGKEQQAANAGAGMPGYANVMGKAGLFAAGPIGIAALQGNMAKRLWDKWNGNNEESWLGALNPFGSHGRSTSTDGVSGGGSTGTTNTGGGATGTNSGATAAEVIGYAEKNLGKPYIWGGTGPKGFDCSGLMQWAYGKAGVKLPRVAAAQQKIGKPVDTNKVQPGDLLFSGNPAHHVVMAIGGGQIIEAPRTGLKVRIRKFSPGEFTNARRILGSVGDMKSLTNGDSTSSDTQNDTAGNSGGNIGGSYGGTSELAAIMSALGGTSAGGSVGMTSSTSSQATTSSPTSVVGSGSNKTSSLKSYAKKLLSQYGWAGQWDDFNALEMSEAGWNPKAKNASSGAYGLAQALPASKYNSAGSDWKTNGETQLRWMMSYIDSRYGSPSKAWSFHQKNNWYAAGAWNIDKDQGATVHKGEMIIPADQAETIRQTLLNNTFNPNLTKGSSSSSVQVGNIYVTLPTGYSGTATEAKLTGKMIVDAMDEQLRIKNLQIGQ
jgi:cell wall-associated NlpC family hydrolase